ncbi:MAG: respiratory nitrate reductase subunit gamma [Planctomycetes bacterium]|nr:respiratory nitrate reductase subunit gamma [Planctomycetota bacterium]
MIDSFLLVFLLVGLPYVAVLGCIAGSIWRFRSARFSYSALSSQFLEDKSLVLGSLPWHLGIFVVLAGHAVAFLIPRVWAGLVSNPGFLWTVEAIGLAASVLALIGLTTLLVRRLTSGRVQAVTTPIDLTVLALLLAQVVLGILVAVQHSFGAAWATGTVSPYLWSLATLRPNPALVSDLPPLVQAHMALAWVLVLLIPFSRLVHIFSIPIAYLWRAPQLVVWANPRRFQGVEAAVLVPARRYFLRGVAAISVGGALLAAGTAGTFGRFFFGPRPSEKEQTKLDQEKLTRLRQTQREKELTLERARQRYIKIAKVKDLDTKKGRYFIDYEMRAALAFLGDDGLPLFISAKCTHLGCTVASDLDAQGRVLCPCHVSYFDIKTGMPNAGAPAKDPLPHIAWVLMDAKGDVVMRRGADGRTHGDLAPDQAALCDVYIAKREESV